MGEILSGLGVISALLAFWFCCWWPERYVHDLNKALDLIKVLSIVLAIALASHIPF